MRKPLKTDAAIAAAAAAILEFPISAYRATGNPARNRELDDDGSDKRAQGARGPNGRHDGRT